MIINKKMQEYLAELDRLLQGETYSIELPGYEYVIFPQFIEWNECVLLENDETDSLPASFKPTTFIPDRTGFEANHNHVHLNDLIEVTEDHPNEVLRIALKIMRLWEAGLYKEFHKTKKLLLILTFDGEDAVLRFHAIRETEPPWLNIESLDSFLEGVLLVEI
ncbi:hypothetical protein J4772_13795 [Cohnella sp. LGH]|uniref:hypothetical protein n=1 Tax=Cohnella sp. LGH TaxID=1619153 RepID=UPI001AD97AD4|nr:hypothetical protein [Cohnella sp. LGH]QTH45382.1 hypothetical protein J4772_13795 [Cohnella sp. LGH]